MKNMETVRREAAPRPKETNSCTFNNSITSSEAFEHGTSYLCIRTLCFMDFHLIAPCLLTRIEIVFQNLKYRIL